MDAGRTWSVIVCVALCGVLAEEKYTVPDAKVEILSPKGVRISIPDIPEGATLVAFHININLEFDSLDHGHYAKDIIKKRDGRWTYTIPDLKVKQGDTIYYWIYMIVDRLGYHGLDRSYKVTQADPHGTGTPAGSPGIGAPDRDTDRPCQPSVTTHKGGQTVCQGQVILDKKFNNLDGWTHEVKIGGTQPEDEFMVFMDDSAVVFLENGNLVIKPILLEQKYDDTFVRAGTLNLRGRCTSTVPEECSRQAVSYLILPPVLSARLNTKNNFGFRYGTVEIKAKLPHGNWIVPELWLQQPGTTSRVVVGATRKAANNWLLESGVIVSNSPQLANKLQDNHWFQDFHIFKLIWTKDFMEFSVDDEQINRIPAVGQLNDKECYITLGIHVAGSRDFADNIQGKPWKNSDPKRFVKFWEAKDSYTPTWNQDSALRVEYIKVTAL